MIREVLRAPNVVLNRVSVEVDPLADEVVQLADDLVDTMRASPGCVGLAAAQVGVSWRLFCLDVTGHRHARSCHGLVVLANPTLVATGDVRAAREGCLSVPELTGNVPRPASVVMRGVAPGTGIHRTVEADAIEARGLLHELDHLDGRLFLDRVLSLRDDVFPRVRRR